MSSLLVFKVMKVSELVRSVKKIELNLKILNCIESEPAGLVNKFRIEFKTEELFSGLPYERPSRGKSRSQ
jgi:hypothetical protein